MDEDAFWVAFTQTGAPEDYLRYCRARREKEERAAAIAARRAELAAERAAARAEGEDAR